MTTLRNAFLAIAGLVGGVTLVALFATIGLAVLGGVVVAGLAGAVVARLMPARKLQTGYRVRRDGQGVIIDM